MKIRKDITGMRFGRLVAIRVSDQRNHRTYWACRCDCGNSTEVVVSKLLSEWTQSCGCLHRESITTGRTTHGQGGSNDGKKKPTVEFRTWSNIKNRCHNPKGRNYADYGGRGIFVCERWRGPDGFVNFFADMGKRPGPGYSIERIDNNGPYSKENCRWATRLEQSANTRKARLLTHNGITMTMNRWGKSLGFKCGTAIHSRLKNGWTVEEAVTTPRPSRFLPTQNKTEPAGVNQKGDFSPEDELTD